METNRALYLGLILFLLLVDCSILDFKVNVSAKTDLQDSQLNNKKDPKDQGGESSSVSDSSGVDEGKKKKEIQVDDLKEKIGGDTKDNDSNKLSSQSGSKKDDTIDNSNNNNSNDSSSQSGSKKTDNLEGKVEDDDSKKETIPKEKNRNEGDSRLPSKDSRVEGCDPSNKCTDEENQLVACLRVPGNDQYSLLVQNKGKNPLTVTISAPDYVQIEKTEIQLQSNEDKKVPVSITHGGSDNLIVLRAGNGHCDLDIRHLVTENFGNQLDNSQKTSYINFVSRTPIIVVLGFAALLILAAVWTCISLRRKQVSSSGSKYQRLDMELPVSTSTGGKAESEQDDGWDDKWGDDWDDEEAPKTPSMPLTPSLSSKGLASRRLSKEGWKD